MRFRKRRRPVEWIDTNYSSAPDFDGAKYGVLPFLTLEYPGGATPYTPVINSTPVLVGDEPSAGGSLTEERKSYTIRRIVGDLHFFWGRQSDLGTGVVAGLHPIMAKWGFAVQNVVPDNASLVAGPELLWDPFDSQRGYFNEMDWMSMRTEIYGSNNAAYFYQSTQAPGAGLIHDQQDLVFANQVQDALGYYFPPARHHHVDLRVNRTVRRNQRLFMTLALSGLSADSTLFDWSHNHHKMFVYADLRVLINWKSAYNRKG